jgi:hypothetical protein
VVFQEHSNHTENNNETREQTPDPNSLKLTNWVEWIIQKGLLAHSWDENQECWWFVRLVRHHYDVENLTAKKAFQAITKIVKRVWGSWEDAGMNEDDIEAEFFASWETIRLPLRADPLDYAFDLSERDLLELLPEVQDRRPRGYVRFVSLAMHLQFVRGAAPIFLPDSRVAKLLGCNPATLSRYRRWAQVDEYLIEVEKATRNRATRFVANVGEFPLFDKRCSKGTLQLWKDCKRP